MWCSFENNAGAVTISGTQAALGTLSGVKVNPLGDSSLTACFLATLVTGGGATFMPQIQNTVAHTTEVFTTATYYLD
jgi:hypothetical protein